MAGTLVADTLMDGAGNSTAMDNAIYGSAKAWGSYAYVSASVPTLRKAYNISSITRSSTGVYVLAFTNALPDANYSVVSSTNTGSPLSFAGISSGQSKLTTSVTMYTGYASTTSGGYTAFDQGFDFVVND